MLQALLLLLSVTPVLAEALPPYHAGTGDRTPPSGLERELTSQAQRLLRRATGLAPAHDEALSAACCAAADAITFDSQGISASELVRASLEHAGVTDAVRFPFTLRTSPEGRAPLAELRSLVRAHVVDRRVTHLGVGVAGHVLPGGSRVIVLVFVQRMVHLAPFPRAASSDERLVLEGSVDESYGFPEVLVATPGGAVRRLPVFAGERTRFWCAVSFHEGLGAYTLEVLTGDRFGLQVANLFPVYVDTPAPRLPIVRLLRSDPPGATPGGLEERLILLLNEARVEAGVAPLRRHPLLSVAARAHSAEMARWDYFGHRDPARGPVRERLARLGFAPSRASEAISIAPSAFHAHADLLRSPSHRRVLLDPDMTHVGVGVVPVDDGPRRRLVITQELARVP